MANDLYLLYPIDTGDGPKCSRCRTVMVLAVLEVRNTKPDFISFRCENLRRVRQVYLRRGIVAVCPANRRRWTEDYLAKLKSMAGKYPAHQIAIELDRGLPAVVMKAFEIRGTAAGSACPIAL
jgi:hypothetical protein